MKQPEYARTVILPHVSHAYEKSAQIAERIPQVGRFSVAANLSVLVNMGLIEVRYAPAIDRHGKRHLTHLIAWYRKKISPTAESR